MGKILLEKSKRKIVESIFEYDTENGKCYSIHFTDSEEAVWCENVSDIYIAIEKHVNGLKLK